MMNFYIIGIIFFCLLIIGCIFLLIYYIKDEKKLKEVSNSDFLKLGKVYSKEEFEDKLFNIYHNILESIQYSNYSFLKDAVSDQIYNQILMEVKENQDKQETDVISNIKKDFSKLISFEIANNLEIAKIWIRYSSIEYVKAIRKMVDQNNNEITSEVVVKGDKDNPVNHEYVLIFVKEKTETENITCPSCGYQTHMLTSSRCIRCDNEIIPKRMHWVLVEKVPTNIEN